MIEDVIKKLGLSENQAKIYMALLELGPSLVTEISKKSGINRTTCYDVLEKMVGYNLVSYASGRGSKKKYAAEAPNKLISYLDRKKRIYASRLHNLREYLPELESIYKKGGKPVIRFFEGTEGLKSIYDQQYDARISTDIMTIVDWDAWSKDELAGWLKKYYKRYESVKFPERMITLPTPTAVKWMTEYLTPPVRKKITYRFLPKDRFPFFATEINVWGDVMWLYILEKSNRMAIEIISPHLANTFKIIFELAWEAAEKYTPPEVLKEQK